MSDIFYWVLTHGDAVLMWILVAVGGLVSALILKTMKAGTVRDIVGRALSEVGTAVMAVAQGYVDALKAASADGVLTDQEKAEAKAKALALAKANIGTEGLKKLAKILGVDVDGWLGTKIEAAVKTLQSKVVGTSVATLKVGEVEASASASAPTAATVPQ